MTRSNGLRLILLALLSALTLQVLAACETSEGFGRDVQGLGKDIEDEAKDN